MTAAEPPGPDPQRERRIPRALVVSAALLAVALITVWLGFDPWLRARVKEKALQRGVLLEFEDYSLAWDELQLHRVSFRQDRPLVVSGTCTRVRIQLEEFRARSITLEAPQVDLVATGSELQRQATAPASSPQAQGSSPLAIHATDMQLRWLPAAAAEPMLSLSNANLVANAAEYSLQGQFGMPAALGQFHVKWARAAHTGEFDVAFGPLGVPKISGEVSAAADPMVAQLTLHPTPIGPLLAPVLKLKEAFSAIASAKVELEWPTGLSTHERGGRILVTLKNFVPPHPAELNGFDFGKQTDLASDFVIARDARQLTFKNTRVQAGSFALSGNGVIDRAHAELRLQGTLSCAMLAKAAAEARLGSILGHWAGKLARRRVEGSLAFEVLLGVDFRGRIVPRLEKTISPGCGLKPLTLNDLPTLSQLGADLRELEAQLRKEAPAPFGLGSIQLPNLLPDVGFPTLPELPKLPTLEPPTSKKLDDAPQPQGSTPLQPEVPPTAASSAP